MFEQIVFIFDKLRNVGAGVMLQVGMLVILFATWFLADEVLKRLKKNVVRYIGQYFGPTFAGSIYVTVYAVAAVHGDREVAPTWWIAASLVAFAAGLWIVLLNMICWKIVVEEDGFVRYRFFWKRSVRWAELRRVRYNRYWRNAVCELKAGGKVVATFYAYNVDALVLGAASGGVPIEGIAMPQIESFD